MHKNFLYYALLAVVLAVIIFYEPIFGILLIPAYVALIVAAESIRKGNLPKDIDTYKVLWKDSLNQEKTAENNMKNASIALYDRGIGYSNYFVPYEEILSIKQAGPSISHGVLPRILAQAAHIRTPDNKYGFLKIVAKNRTVIFEIQDFESFRKHLKKLGYESLIDASLRK